MNSSTVLGDKPLLRFRTLWLGLGWLMVTVVAVASLMPVPVDLSEGRDKYTHLATYGVLMSWFAGLYWPQSRRARIAIALAALGILLEGLQGMTAYRSFEPGDIAANLGGVMLGWIVALGPLKHVQEWVERFLPPRHTPRTDGGG